MLYVHIERIFVDHWLAVTIYTLRVESLAVIIYTQREQSLAAKVTDNRNVVKRVILTVSILISLYANLINVTGEIISG